MSSQVWLRFEKKERDGSLMKLRIQDMPEERIGEATDLMVKYFLRDEPFRRALGFLKNSEAIEEYRVYVDKVFRSSRNVMCCLDTDEKYPGIMGISSICVAYAAYWELTADKGTTEATTISKMYYDCIQACDLMKVLNLTSYYSDKSILVVPEHRGYGIAEKFLTVRRLMCAAHNIPVTGAWLSNFASQVAAERDGWGTLHEIPFEFFSQKYGVTFEDVPPTIRVRLAVARPHPDYHIIIKG